MNAMQMTETKFARTALSAVDEDGSFAGYASLFGKADLGRDVVQPGAFRASLARRGAGGVKMLFQHDPNQPIGVWTEIREDGQGLFVRGRLTTGVARAREVLSLMRAWQADLATLGFYAGAIDGIAGPVTNAAVLAYQRAHPDLQADGIVGPATRASLARDVAARRGASNGAVGALTGGVAAGVSAMMAGAAHPLALAVITAAATAIGAAAWMTIRYGGEVRRLIHPSEGIPDA